MKISVIIPSFKPQSYLFACLDSICKQTFPLENFEVIIVLNGCCEPYDSNIKKYLLQHPYVQWRYLQTDTAGVSNARNIALDAAIGKSVAFIDDDDYVSPAYLEELFKASNDGESVSLSYPYAFVDGTDIQQAYILTKSFDKYHHTDGIRPLKVRQFFNGPCMKLIPMKFIRERRFDIRFTKGEDSLFMFLISDRIKQCRFTSKNAIYYRRRRDGSAYFSRRKFHGAAMDAARRIYTYCRYYFHNPSGYDFLFFISRIIGTIKGTFTK
ncbi:MAG: glycosyltransferase family 2 protein [Bacteroidales bacterium]|nr:glycosyltransferase family 2 protein [Candidatus Cacconaster merdequi]